MIKSKAHISGYGLKLRSQCNPGTNQVANPSIEMVDRIPAKMPCKESGGRAVTVTKKDNGSNNTANI